jgi:hypothetical protein
VFVALGIQHAIQMCSIILSVAPPNLQYFCKSSQEAQLKKIKIIEYERVFIFSIISA